MLEFFRRYQRTFFVVITTVIVISFVFFGTDRAFTGNVHEDKVAFTAIDGSNVLHSEVNDMVNFLATDFHDYLFSGGTWGGNGLNDGVIANDILQEGLGQVIAAPYLSRFGKEYQSKLEREKRYTPYVHPKAAFLTAEQIWNYYAPDVKTHFDLLRSYKEPGSEAFSSRVQLYVAERRFPAAYLKQLLRQQEASHKWLPQDQTLASRDLSLFGYHSLQDWFGGDFLELVAQFIINGSKMAEQKGYSVSKEEVLGSLYRNAELSFKEGRGNSYVGITNPGEFFHEQLRRLRMDQSRVLKTWTSVLLFRQFFFDNADSILVDQLPYKKFCHHLNEFVDIDLYQLPPEFRFESMRDVQQFGLYLNAVGGLHDWTSRSEKLVLPKQFLAPKEVKKIYPELVERKFQIRWVGMNKEQLQTKIGVRNTWEWQVSEENWKKLQEQFPELVHQESNTSEERLLILDRINPTNRAAIDSFSRMSIVDEHPEWIEQALADMPLQEEFMFLREQGGHTPFDGISNAFELIQLLDTAPLNEQSGSLGAYTQDNVFYYRMEVLDRSFPEKILSFKDAKDDGTMDQVLDKVLEAAYVRIRTETPAKFLKENGEWKPFRDVKDLVANVYFEPLNHFLNEQLAAAKENDETKGYIEQIEDFDKQRMLSAVALLSHVAKVATALDKLPGEVPMLVVDKTQNSEEVDSQETGPSQWKLIKSRKRIVRMDESPIIDPELAFSIAPQSISPVVSYDDSGPCFFTEVLKGYLPSNELIREKVFEERNLLKSEIIISLAQDILSQMQQKEAAFLEKEKGGNASSSQEGSEEV